MREMRVRFAPSPTGYLHVGGARTALYNWLFARREGGRFILRIEDTDIDRSRTELVTGILEGLEWLGLNWDEGPYYQSERLKHYRSLAEELVRRDYAYPCFCTAEELESKRARAQAERRAWKYDGTCRRLSEAERGARRRAGQPYALRYRVPAAGLTVYEDRVFGRLQVENSSLEDFVLLRSDGQPTYHLSVVADDLEMGITHVIRGADHLPNTPKQILMYQALEAPLPEFAHLPLILGPDRTRLSKRHGATSVTAYREQRILPEALRNFLALLGWTPPARQEILPLEEMIQTFALEDVSKSNAVFDPEKLAWMNSEYLRTLPLEQLLRLVEQELRSAGLWREPYGGEQKDWFLETVALLQPRARTLKDFSQSSRAFFTDDFAYEEEAVKKFWKEPSLAALLAELAASLAETKPFDAQSAEAALRAFADGKQVKAGLLINAARVALTGQGVAPSLFEVMRVLGQARVVARLRSAAEFLARETTAAP